MAMFETSVQQLEETEDEFMISLVKIFKEANPAVSAKVFDTAVRLKFLQDISPVFIFQ